MALDERRVDGVTRENFSSDVVPDREIRARLEDNLRIREIGALIAISREVDDSHSIGVRELTIGYPRPEDRVALGHIGSPGDDGIRVFDVVAKEEITDLGSP